MRNGFLVFSLALSGLLAHPAHAYIDPNVGGWLYQALYPIIALAAGTLLFLRTQAALLLHRIRNKIARILRR